MILPNSNDFLAYSRQLFPKDNDLAVLNAMSNMTEEIDRFLYGYLALTDELKDNETSRIFHEKINAIMEVYHSTLYYPTKKVYLKESEKYMAENK